MVVTGPADGSNADLSSSEQTMLEDMERKKGAGVAEIERPFNRVAVVYHELGNF